jgi:hypothetical protein
MGPTGFQPNLLVPKFLLFNVLTSMKPMVERRDCARCRPRHWGHCKPQAEMSPLRGEGWPGLCPHGQMKPFFPGLPGGQGELGPVFSFCHPHPRCPPVPEAVAPAICATCHRKMGGADLNSTAEKRTLGLRGGPGV